MNEMENIPRTDTRRVLNERDEKERKLAIRANRSAFREKQKIVEKRGLERRSSRPQSGNRRSSEKAGGRSTREKANFRQNI